MRIRTEERPSLGAVLAVVEDPERHNGVIGAPVYCSLAAGAGFPEIEGGYT